MDHSQRLTESTSEDGRYRLLVDAITDYAIYMLDPTGIVTNWNAGAQRFKGYRADEIIGEHFSRFYTDEHRAAGLPQRALEIARTEGKFEREGWRLRKGGERFWAHVVIDPIWAPNGELIGFAKITRDLTERKHAADTLRESEEQFRLLVHSVTDYAIYRLDPKGDVISWNPGAERIKGYRPHEVIGGNFSRFYTDEDRAAGEPERALGIARIEGRFVAEGWRVRKDGSRFRASVVIDPIRDEAGALLGFAKITRDITEREEQQKTLEAAREALFQSQKMDAIGQLTGGVAHDFNNLLMAIQTSLVLLRKRMADDPIAQRLIDTAVQGAERGSALTQRMLAFARRQDLAPERVDLLSLVRGMTDLLKRTLGPSYPIDLQFPLSLAPVMADANQLEMALLNLAVNARDALAGGGPISIAAREKGVDATTVNGLKAGRYVVLSVSDRGIGMDAPTLARATEPFFTTKGVGKGTGLGLSMIHGLAQQLGGMLAVRSALGEGTTAELWLPALSEAVSAPAAVPTEPAPAGCLSRRLKILAVDGDSLVLMNTAALLEDLGHEVIEASSGREALELLDGHADIDLLITDQAMPNLTGVQLAAAALDSKPGLPVILATGYGELPPDSPARIIKLAKPFGQPMLERALTEAMTAIPA